MAYSTARIVVELQQYFPGAGVAVAVVGAVVGAAVGVMPSSAYDAEYHCICLSIPDLNLLKYFDC